MKKEQVFKDLQNIFDNVFLDDIIITPDLSADDIADWDSLTHITLIITIEKAFDLKFRVGEVENTKNVGEFVDLILERLNEKH